VRLAIAGKVSPALKAVFRRADGLRVCGTGAIPQIDRSAHLLFSADLNAACPNSVIEALACGLPVIAFDTGALPEMVDEHAGRIVPYGGNPWRLDPPDIFGLAQACMESFLSRETLQVGARRQAEERFGLENMVSAYLDILAVDCAASGAFEAGYSDSGRVRRR
jgi:glycosyltransferase involved in cell wall biosynthesis